MQVLRSNIVGPAGVRGLSESAVLQCCAPACSLVSVVFTFFFIKKLHSYQQSCFISLLIFFRPGHKAACSRASHKIAAAHAVKDSSCRTAPLLAIEAATVATAAISAAPKMCKPVCGFCGEAKEKLLLCSKCKSVRYCDAGHQRQHW